MIVHLGLLLQTTAKRNTDLFMKWHLKLLSNLLLSWCCFLPPFLNRLCRIYLDSKLLAFHSFYGLCRLSTNLLYTNSALIWYGKACNHGNVLCTLSQALAAVFTLYRIEQIIYILTIQLFFFLLIPS